jgi:MOSC domain-containing protein YiiM
VSEAQVEVGSGIVGNADRSRRRPITLLEAETWLRLMNELNAHVDPSARRANLLVSGIPLANTRDRVVRIGTVRLRINGETTPCERMDDALPGLQEAMRPGWGGGAFAQVLTAGTIRVGDPVVWDGERL